MKKYHRVTVYLQDDQDTMVRQARLVDAGDLEAIDRVFKLFNLQYEADEIAPGTRLYSLTASMGDRYISDNLLTSKELEAHASAYIGRGKPVETAEFKKLIAGKISQIYKTTQAGEILMGYELATRKEASKSIFDSLKFSRKKKSDKVA